MAQAFEYLVLKTPSDAEIFAAGLLGWELITFKGSDAWFKRPTIV